MPKKIVIIQGHPDPAGSRFCHALADAYASGAEEAGHTVRRIEVGQLDFSLLRTETDFETGEPPDAIRAAQADILWADHLVFVYPLWLGTMPALLKGFLEQTIRPDFAFERTTDKWPRKILTHRSARVIITMGMPAFAYRWFYRAHGLKNLERNILHFCGIKPVRNNIVGMIGQMTPAKAAGWLEKIREKGRRGV